MILKAIQPGAYNFSEPLAQLIKISSRGLIGHDRGQLIKRAGSQIAYQLDNVKWAKDEIPIHLIAMGSTEDYGPNRNADGWRREMLRACHSTFVKHARWYRNHANKDKSKSYGVVKLSAYHEPMHRVELICGLNGSEECARINGGLVADREMEKLARGEEIADSMAANVPYDECSFCGNRARTRAEYCDSLENGGHCKAGGLKHNIGTVLEDGSILHADNPLGTFFDISHVWRPADRIAYVTGRLQKAAAAGQIISGAQLAEELGITIPYELLAESDWPADVARQMKLAHQMADVEPTLTDSNVSLAFADVVQPAIAAPPTQCKLAQVFRALADEKVLLPVRDFLYLATHLNEKQAAELAPLVSTQLPGIFGRLVASPDLPNDLRDSPYTAGSAASVVARTWAAKQAAAHSLAPAHLQPRVKLAAVRGAAMTRLTALVVEPKLEKLARHYALYQLGFLDAISGNDADSLLTRNLLALQNCARSL